MRSHVLHRLMLVVALGGCAAGASVNGSAGRDAGASPSGGSRGSGGSSYSDGSVISLDASLDAGKGRSDVGQGNYLSSDGPTFNWDTLSCIGCRADAVNAADAGIQGSGGSSSGSGGAAGNGPGTGGASTPGGWGGAGGSATAGTGGSTGSAGSMDAGGSMGTGGWHSNDASALDAGVAPDGGRDALVLPDARPDTSVSDVVTPCVARIQSIVPASSAILNMSAGPNAEIVLRAEVVSGGPASPAWAWQGYYKNAAITASAIGQVDSSAVSFPIVSSGEYSFIVRDSTGACRATLSAKAAAASDYPDFDQSVRLHVAPPSSSSIPIQDGYIPLLGSEPFSQSNVLLVSGTGIRISPSMEGSLVPSYVRIIDQGGGVVVDGLASASSPFTANLMAADNNGNLRLYDVLVVPVDGSVDGILPPTAPQLFQNLGAMEMNRSTFNLSGELTVSGTVTDSLDRAVVDARVILTNQNPSQSSQPDDLIFSSVGHSDAQGRFSLHAQPGNYWVTVSPPSASGLTDAVVPSPISLAANATLSFQWDTVSTAAVALTVNDAAGVASAGTKVRVRSAAAAKVGTLTFGSTAQDARGRVEIQGTTSAAGAIRFANVPDGVSYDVLLSPGVLGANAATTTIALSVPVGGVETTIRLAAQGQVRGKLLPSSGKPIDWSQTNVVAYDRNSDSPEAAVGVTVGTDGTFSIGVSPGRPYVLVAIPPVSSGYARTFVGPGPLQASEFTIRQKVQESMDWVATVMDQAQVGVPRVALQVFCGAIAPGCIDSKIALAETTSGEGGVFHFNLPDPATR